RQVRQRTVRIDVHRRALRLQRLLAALHERPQHRLRWLRGRTTARDPCAAVEHSCRRGTELRAQAAQRYQQTPRGPRRNAHPAHDPGRVDPARVSERLSVSVVICAYTERRWADLQRAVDSLYAQHTRPDQIVVVIDYNHELFDRARREFPDADVVENVET